MFDILRFYQDNKVDYYLDGKNVMEDWVNVCCPFCDDKSNHLGVYLKNTTKIKCWRCGQHSLPSLLEQFSDKDVKFLYKEYLADGEEVVYKKKEKTSVDSDEIESMFAENSQNNLTDHYMRYLAAREFLALDMYNEWGVRGGHMMGDYKYRLMIPILHGGKIVSFQGRDVTEQQDDKYKTCRGTYVNDYLYGLDYITGDSCIVMEGVTDVWRIGKGKGVCTFGINYSQKQVKLLIDKGIKKVMIFFDSEHQAQEKAEKLKGELELFDIEVLNFTIKDKDPADLSDGEVKKIIKLLEGI